MKTPTPELTHAYDPERPDAPRMLLVDTSGPICRVVYAEGERVRVQLRLDLGLTHSTRLSPAIRDVLAAAGQTTDSIELWGAVRGPGSFTGLRIGVATIQGLALVTGRPVVGLSTLASFADSDVPVPVLSATDGEAGGNAGGPTLTVPLMDARNRRAYFAAFRGGADGQGPVRLRDDAVDSYEEVLAMLQSLFAEGPCRTLRIVGDNEAFLADEAVREALAAEAAGRSIRSLPLASPPADAMAREAMRQVRAGGTMPPDRLEPAYLAPTQAERNLAKRRKG